VLRLACNCCGIGLFQRTFSLDGGLDFGIQNVSSLRYGLARTAEGQTAGKADRDLTHDSYHTHEGCKILA